MLFNSITFIIFILIVVPLHFLVSPKYKWVLLLIASYFFYMFWNPFYIFLIIISTVIDYYMGRKMSDLPTKNRRRPYLILSIVTNLGLLFTFKYFNFFTGTLNSLLASGDINYEFTMLDVLLPVGISFYTFQTLSYSADIYKGVIKCEKHIGKFALFVAFFPQLVAGPIERAANLLPQFRHKIISFNYERFLSGFSQVLLGFFKKVVVADLLAIYIDSIYGNYQLYYGFTLLFATYMFAFQIYCDFSGYSDIAIGVARIMGYDLMENFKLPYFSKNITEFWHRWHISLSTWLRDYLYIPLGGNRKGEFNTYVNLMITMLLGGLWHGASWNFVFWGALNGIYLSIERIINLSKIYNRNNIFIKGLLVFITFNFICLTWIFFRSHSFEQSFTIFHNIFYTKFFWNLRLQDTGIFASMIANLFVLLLIEYFIFRKFSFTTLIKQKNISFIFILDLFLVFLIILFGVSEGDQFIYFQF
ncbi:MAG: MBOAT family protein [Cytophagales bacterium]|nr:MBOAT family protein [Cytophagales bacterium]